MKTPLLLAALCALTLRICDEEEPPAPAESPGEPGAEATPDEPEGGEPTPAPAQPLEPAHDLAGAPPWGPAPADCTPVDEPHVLRGAALTGALRTLKRGDPPAGHNHLSFTGSCEKPATEIAQAFYDGGRALHRRGKHQLATTLYTQALRADPSHVWARYQLACVLALTGRPVAAVTHLSELARSEDGRQRLRDTAGRDSELDSLRGRSDFLALMFPRTDLAGEPEPLSASGPEHDVATLLPPDPAAKDQKREPIEFLCSPRPRCEWPNFNQLLAATEPISGGTRRAYNRSELNLYRLVDDVPATARADGFEGWGSYFYWHPAEGVTYLVVSYTLLGGNAQPHGYAIYERSSDAKARLVHHFETGSASCATAPDASPLELFFATEGYTEIREISGCGTVAAFNRIVWEDGGLKLHRGRLQLRIDPQTPTTPVPEQAAPIEIPEVAGAPAFGPPETCEPRTGEVISGAALRGHLDSIRRGQIPEGITVSDLLGSCTVEPADVAEAFASGAMARYHEEDRDGFREFNLMGLRTDRSHARSRYNYACALSLAGRVDDAMLHLRELAKGGRPVGRWFFWSLADTDLRNVRARPEYWELLESLREPPVKLHDRFELTIAELEPGEETVAAEGLTPPGGSEHLVRAEAPWRTFVAMLNHVMTERPYEPASRDSLWLDDAPAAIRRKGIRPLLSPQWWTPVEGHTILLVPYHHPESGFNAVAFFEPTEGGFHYLGRDRSRNNDCYDGADFEAVVITNDADEVRLGAGCEGWGYFARYRHEGGAFRRIYASLRPPEARGDED